MSLAQTVATCHLNAVLERLISTTMLFRRRDVNNAVPVSVASAMPGLEVSESTWAEWESAVAESYS